MIGQTIILAGFATCVIGAAINDVRKFEIADIWSILILFLYVCHAAIIHPDSYVSHVAAPLIVFAGAAGLFALGWMGGGDVKLITAIAAWTGLEGLPALLMGTVLSGGVLALVIIGARARLTGAPDRTRVARETQVPYAVAIAGGTAFWAFSPAFS
jgi:prepilin peptidase CpaA